MRWVLKELDLKEEKKKKKLGNWWENSDFNCKATCGPGGAEVAKVVSPEKM